MLERALAEEVFLLFSHIHVGTEYHHSVRAERLWLQSWCAENTWPHMFKTCVDCEYKLQLSKLIVTFENSISTLQLALLKMMMRNISYRNSKVN